MDDVTLGLLVIVCLQIGLIILIYTRSGNLSSLEEDFHDRLDVMEEGLKVVATVLTELPNLVPQFSIDANPLSQILEFFTSLREKSEPSLIDKQLRDDSGRFSDGEEETT